MDIKKFKVLGDLQHTNSDLNREFEQRFVILKRNIIENDKKIIIKYFNDNEIKTRDEVSRIVAGYGQSYLTVKLSNPEDNFIGANMRYEIEIKAGNVYEYYLLAVLLDRSKSVIVETTSKNELTQKDEIDKEISEFEERNRRLKLLIENMNTYQVTYQIYKGHSLETLIKKSDNLIEVLSEIFN